MNLYGGLCGVTIYWLQNTVGFPSAHGENINKEMSKQFRSLTHDCILSKYFDYYLTQKDKALVVFLSLAH